MEKFTELTASACPLDIANLNTDQLLPARFLKLPRSAGLGKFCCTICATMPQGRERADFPLNRPAWREARILVGQAQFRLRLVARSRRSMRSTITAFAASSRRPSATSLPEMRSRTDCSRATVSDDEAATLMISWMRRRQCC